MTRPPPLSFRTLILTGAALLAPQRGEAQRRVTRPEALAAAIAAGPRFAVARADTTVATAGLRSARMLQNPSLGLAYTKDVPQYHAILDIPLDVPWLRSPRVKSAEAGQLAARYRFEFERAAITLEADTLYTRALAAQAHARLSRRNAQDADSLLRMAAKRRDAGDASDLEVELASVNAGQQTNVAANDSLAYVSALLDLQTVMGLASSELDIVPGDSLEAPTIDEESEAPGTRLQIAAAEQSLISAEFSTRFQRRSVWGAPSLVVGFDAHDPTGDEKGLLPQFGIGIPLPLFHRNGGPILQAAAEEQRARAELTMARIEDAARTARTRRERDLALARVARDRVLITSASRVAAMSLTAYREGEVSLPNVLAAQRTAREVVAQYIDDLATAWNATSALRVFTLTAAGGSR